jgi:hypothetical protein
LGYVASKKNPLQISDDLPSRAVDFIDLVVNTINDRVIRPIILVGRTFVFGILIAVLVGVVAVVISVAALRLLDVYAFAHHVWVSYLILGVAFSAVGLFAWSKRSLRSNKGGRT